MQYIVRIASYAALDGKRLTQVNMPARDYQDALDIKYAMESHTEHHRAVVCVRTYTQAGPVLLAVDELDRFHTELNDIISDIEADIPKRKSA